MNLVTCNKCGYVHFEFPLEEIEQHIKTFNDFYDQLPNDRKQAFYNGHKLSLEQYKVCIRCSNDYMNFRDSVDDDCPDGWTINPINPILTRK
jgi:transcription elongation factor Elf1